MREEDRDLSVADLVDLLYAKIGRLKGTKGKGFDDSSVRGTAGPPAHWLTQSPAWPLEPQKRGRQFGEAGSRFDPTDGPKIKSALSSFYQINYYLSRKKLLVGRWEL